MAEAEAAANLSKIWNDLRAHLEGSTHRRDARLAPRLLRLLEALSGFVVPPADEQVVDALDQITIALVEPDLLHHASKRLQSLVLACLQQALRVHRLGDSAPTPPHPPHPPKPGREEAPHNHTASSVAAPSETATPPQEIPPRTEDPKPQPSRSGASPPEAWLTAGGELCQLIRERDWATTPFGPPSQWHPSLKIALTTCLFSRFPFVIFWGREYRMLYNDTYRPIMGANKHPLYLGDTYRKCWPTIWEEEHMLMDTVTSTHIANWVEDKHLPMDRNGYLEECYFTYSYSPLFIDDGSVGGVFTACTENTHRVIGERQLRTLRDLAARGTDARTVNDAVRIVCDIVATTGKYDVAFSNIYLLDTRGRRAVLIETAGDLVRGSHLCPELVSLPRTRQSDTDDSSKSEDDTDEEQGGIWCSIFNEAITKKEPQQLSLVPFGREVPPCRAWSNTDDDRTRSCLILPLISHGVSEKVVGVLVAGVNPRHELDDIYRIFFNLFANNVSSIIMNATAREEERQRAEALAELDRAKTTFFSNISHEFRTPLTLMLGPLEDLLGQAELQIEKEQLTLIHRNALRLYKLVNSLLDFSRLEDGRARANFEPVALGRFTQDLASIFRSATERAKVDLVVECEEELEEAVFVDKDMWEKIVLNLLSNALKFTMHGHIKISIKAVSSTGATTGEDEVELMVADTGIGIPSEELPLLGKRFHRVQTSGGRSHEGTGIGLALVYELVRLHGGTIEVSSQLGSGSTFRVCIPFGAEHLPKDQIKRVPVSTHLIVGTSYNATTTEERLDSDAEQADEGVSTLADARNYSKTASWWLPSIAVAASPASTQMTPSSSDTGSPYSTSGSSPEMPSSPRQRTAASFCVASSSWPPPAPSPFSPDPSEEKREKRARRLSSSMKKKRARHKAKILLADDNFDMREYVARLLSAKYEVISVSNGLEAVSVLRSASQAVDLVLTDVMMPFLDGFGLLKEIRSRDEMKMLPVIMLSARAGEEASAEGLAEGADDYLTKPFTARELLSRVASHLNMSRMRNDAARTEVSLRAKVTEGKERLERILAAIQDAFMSLDARQRYSFVNTNAAMMLGAKKEAMIGHNVWRFMVDTEDGVVARNLERAMNDKVDVVFDFYYAARDRWYENRMYPGADGGVSIFTIDITARKKAEQRLALISKVSQLLSTSVETHLSSLLAAAVQAVEGSVVADWSIVDVVAEDGQLERIATPNTPTHLWQLHDLDNDNPNGEESEHYYRVVRLSNGQRVGIKCGLSSSSYSASAPSSTPTSRENFVVHLLQGRGRIYGLWVFARESFAHSEYQTEDRAMCKELVRRAGMAIDNAQLYREADSANRAKDHFLAALSHELRTPLTPALLLSEALLAEGLPTDVEDNVRLIHESVMLEVQLIDDLLDLTKISRNKIKLSMRRVTLHEVLSRTVQIVAHDISAKKLVVTRDFQATNDLLVGDPARLQQVFWNILKNATKFTPEDGAITIRTSNYVLDRPRLPSAEPAPQDGNASDYTVAPPTPTFKLESGTEVETERVETLQVEITDTGIGIESHVMPHLFRPFEQGDASITVRFGGLGLGLAISRSLVEMHKGQLTVSSEGSKKGATFVVHLPTDVVVTCEDSKREHEVHRSVSSPASSGVVAVDAPPRQALRKLSESRPFKVLLVEDNKSTLMIMSRLLRQKLGFAVVVASSVADALRVAAEEKASDEGHVDVVVSDIGLPDGSGLELMAALKATYHLPGIALSGYGSEEDVERSRAAGFDIHLTKPVQFAALSAAIHQLFPASDKRC